MLDTLFDYDLSDKIAQLPKHTGYSVLPPRQSTEYITFHYSAVDYPDRSEARELARIIDEAAYQLRTNYGDAKTPAHPDGLLYDWVVLSNGKIVRTRRNPVKLWHVGNAIGNALSSAVHVMLGPTQDMTPAQKQGVYRVFDEVRNAYNIPQQNVIAHCEWPRVNGLPLRSDTYKLLPKQSACPGRRLFPAIVEYRTMNAPTIDPYASWGNEYPLAPDRQQWAIPTAWRANPWLGAATGNEVYIDPNTSVQPFTGGICVYEKATGKAFAVKRNG